METYQNIVLEKLPAHLRKYVVPQFYERYTPIDQALWRYVMRQNYIYLKDVAYYPYIPGLRKAGLTIERIPDLQQMNDSLKQIGWGAVTVDGFIPPAAFMEFQAHRVLVIAADIRQLEHIEYTPAPDIIHESSGHAPIIGEPEYAEYLQYFGEVGSKAMFSAKDFELYEAIRNLSILKEDPNATQEQIATGERLLEKIQQNMGEPSEMALLSRLHWWTVEYGLIGTVDDPKIYGAGLLSSIGESVTCMQPEVPKLPYTLDAVNYSYDITKPQPQLFVTPDFEHLRGVLDEFAADMSFRVGGKKSVDKAIACKNVCTAVYSSGLQVSGIFTAVGDENKLTYIKTSGPTALALRGKQLHGHSKNYHKDGFSAPVGLVTGFDRSLEDMTDADLYAAGIVVGQETVLSFDSGITVTGVLESLTRSEDKLVLLSFTKCTVRDTRTDAILFMPEWGMYDMAVGAQIVSVFSGAADKDAYEQQSDVSEISAVRHAYDESTKQLHERYARIRRMREKGNATEKLLMELFTDLQANFPGDWLSLVELLEIAANMSLTEAVRQIEDALDQIQKNQPHLVKLIQDGKRLAKDTNVSLIL
ncbi:aromatic amino acid hydroxylase [Sphingobacterium psychroaquaticum]|uniref:aromatic amino acid hydroxylase n=1 Tax=Sphingobacterium psychroaquaticum TaxID=561061 RepID=UPI00106AB0CF|nr:aromatic amino acid hydroxylase [Sphingobacterium psychroaquaticum]QBQ42175.1 aromatic amino acid hydroxylase [Sphingobacterium psychroaquaticum]